MTRWAAAVLALIAILAGPAARAAPRSPFADWAVIVVSGDFHAAHTNNPTETFDNARRDVTAELIKKGFSADNIRQFSVRPQNYPGVNLARSDVETIRSGLAEAADRAHAGCLAYFTSHGAPSGVVIGDEIVSPERIVDMIGEACGRRPAIVVLSACFSGVFVPALAMDSNTMVLTAARPDRPSFGCGESDKYPYFDACMLESLPTAHDFIVLASAVQACVAGKEAKIGATPSEPQVYVGAGLRPFLPLMAFAPG